MRDIFIPVLDLYTFIQEINYFLGSFYITKVREHKNAFAIYKYFVIINVWGILLLHTRHEIIYHVYMIKMKLGYAEN